MTRRDRSERGIVLVIAGLLMIGLLVMTAIVIDLGNARQTKRDGQNDVDAAALAGAAMYDGSIAGAALARSRAVEFLDVNDRPSSGSGDARACSGGETCTITFEFTPTPVATPSPPNAGTRYCMRVRLIDLEIDTYFAGVMGVDHTDVNATANGCKRFVGGSASSNIPAALALGTCANAYEAFETSGNDNRFIGDIHSNGSARDTGINNLRSVGAAATTRVPIASLADEQELWVGYTTVPVDEEDPVTPGALTPQQLIAQYAPGGARASEAEGFGLYNNTSGSGGPPDAALLTNDINFSGDIQAGIYYTTKKIVVSGTGVTVTPRTVGATTYTGVVLVSSNDLVEISGNGARLTPFSLSNPDRLTVIAGWDSPGNPCSDTGYNMSGECSRVDGIMYVPFTKATFSNNGNGHDDNGRLGSNCVDTPSYTGALVAYSMKLDGNEHLLRGGVGSTGLTPEVFLDA